MRRLMSGDTVYNSPADLRCRDGSIKDVLLHCNAYFDNGRFVYARCFTREITEHALNDTAQQRLAAIVDSSNDAIIGKDLNGITTSWNRGAERIFGYTAEEAIGKPITLIFPPELIQDEEEILGRIR